MEQTDEREALSAVWKKYYDLDIPAREIRCDGCRCEKPGAERIDRDCPVRACVLGRALAHCGGCAEFPCGTLLRRAGLSRESALAQLGEAFREDEFEAYLTAFDNLTHLEKHRQSSAKS